MSLPDPAHISESGPSGHQHIKNIMGSETNLARALVLSKLMFCGLAVMVMVQLVCSLGWRMEHDTPLLHYAAFMMVEHGAVPYRDLFETSMPGTFAFHYLVVRFLGAGDLAFRLVDLTLLALLVWSTVRFMARFGRTAVAWSVLFIGLLYLSKGQEMSLQRDYIGTVLLAWALNLLPAQASGRGQPRTWFLLGLVFGIAALFKPHLALGWPIVAWGLVKMEPGPRQSGSPSVWGLCLISALGLALPVVLALAWLWHAGALGSFWFMVTRYLPLHNALSGGFEYLEGAQRWRYLLTQTVRLGGYGALFFCGLFGIWRLGSLIRSDADGRRPALAVLTACLLAYAIYPTLAGKFWPYHYMPLAYLCALSVGVYVQAMVSAHDGAARPSDHASALPSRANESGFIGILILATFIQGAPLLLASRLADDLRHGAIAHAPKGGRVDDIAEWLTAHMNPGDTVQPIDWTGGSLHAMLLARAPLATRYLYDYHFHHQLSSPVIQGLQQDFLSQLGEKCPRFVIQVDTNRPWVYGRDTSRAFPALQAFLATNYRPALVGDGYSILEHTRSLCAQPR